MTTPPMSSDTTGVMIRTYRFRLKPTAAQHNRQRAALDRSRYLYNAALEERIDCCRKTGQGSTFFQQSDALTVLRKDGIVFSRSMETAPLKALDHAYKAFGCAMRINLRLE